MSTMTLGETIADIRARADRIGRSGLRSRLVAWLLLRRLARFEATVAARRDATLRAEGWIR